MRTKQCISNQAVWILLAVAGCCNAQAQSFTEVVQNALAMYPGIQAAKAKTEAARALAVELGDFLIIDPDDLRQHIPGYNGSNSWLVQEAVSRIVERILDKAFQQNQSFLLDDLHAFMGSCDALVVTLPLTENTKGMVNTDALQHMRPDAVIVNVGRGAVIDESALFNALQQRQLGGAIIDTWYQYPSSDTDKCAPSQFDFASLPNVLMTSHMSGWTEGTVQRRKQTIADNINRLSKGEPLLNVLD